MQVLLDKYDKGRKVLDVVADYHLAGLLDRIAERPGTKLAGADNGPTLPPRA